MTPPGPRDGGTVLPLLLLGFLLAGTVLAAATAGGAALVARRQLAAACDGAALAGAAALDRTALSTVTAPPDPDPGGVTGRREGPGAGRGTTGRDDQGGGGARVLPVDRDRARAAVVAHLAGVGTATGADVRTDGRTVVVRCRRTARLPFGAVIGRPDGIERVATARARAVLRPST